ncbi:hypothetical protein Syun_016949 [Stephania yunnanensis]|uniref:Condensin complex subunit 1 C-terminal domain-containing protein n=1 Tax=Stephania yunnanensis TaxID=152371 RepID=A0AAP0P1X8_9MAGN
MDLFRVGVGVGANLVEYLVGPLGLGLKDNNGYVRMVAAIGAFKLYHISAATCVDADFPSMLKSLMLHDSILQIVYLALQEIWSLEASSSRRLPRREKRCLASRNILSLEPVYERIKAPLLTLVSSGSQEQSYALLNHLHLLVMRASMLFSSDYKHFYCQYNEPSYVKKLKLDMLTAVANENNTYEIGQ